METFKNLTVALTEVVPFTKRFNQRHVRFLYGYLTKPKNVPSVRGDDLH